MYWRVGDIIDASTEKNTSIGYGDNKVFNFSVVDTDKSWYLWKVITTTSNFNASVVDFDASKNWTGVK